jgi:hypothetical protein
MKLVLSIILFFTIGLSNNQTPQPSSFKISTFTKVPDDMMGCGDDCYLSEGNKKHEILICRTDYATALIHINNKSVLLHANESIKHDKNEEIYISGQYILRLKMTYKKQVDSEDYEFKGTLTITLGEKILYQQKVIGDGGC